MFLYSRLLSFCVVIYNKTSTGPLILEFCYIIENVFWIAVVERFSIRCRKTKTKEINLPNHNKRKQHNQPIKTRIKYMQPASSAARKRVQANHDYL